MQTPKDAMRFITLARACLTCHAYDLLDRIRCPVLVIGGCQDQIVTGEASVELANKLDCELYLYEEFGHGVYEEAADFQERVFRFLQAEEGATQ